MPVQPPKVYHLFLVLAVFNFLTFYLFWGYSVIEIQLEESVLSNEHLYRYFSVSSVLILLVWLTYFFLRRQLRSTRLIWLHLAVVLLTILFVPVIVDSYTNHLPRRWLEPKENAGITDFFGTMTPAFVIMAIILPASTLFVFFNLQRNEGAGAD